MLPTCCHVYPSLLTWFYVSFCWGPYILTLEAVPLSIPPLGSIIPHHYLEFSPSPHHISVPPYLFFNKVFWSWCRKVNTKSHFVNFFLKSLCFCIRSSNCKRLCVSTFEVARFSYNDSLLSWLINEFYEILYLWYFTPISSHM